MEDDEDARRIKIMTMELELEKLKLAQSVNKRATKPAVAAAVGVQGSPPVETA